MQNRILIDSGPLIALFHAKDNHHQNFRNFFKVNQYRFISTLAVFTEVSYFLNVNQKARQDFFEWVLRHGVIISDINQNDIPRIMELTDKYADVPMDFADATLLVAAEKSGIRKIVSLDSDFDIYRLSDKTQVKNVYIS